MDRTDCSCFVSSETPAAARSRSRFAPDSRIWLRPLIATNVRQFADSQFVRTFAAMWTIDMVGSGFADPNRRLVTDFVHDGTYEKFVVIVLMDRE